MKKIRYQFSILIMVSFLNLFISLIQSTTCVEGCSLCFNDTCYFCDFQNGYYYNSSTYSCGQLQIENCAIYGVNGNCLQCKLGYYPSQTGVQCSPVAGENPNCLIHDYNQNCVQCEQNYYLGSQTNSCVKVVSFIPNCVLYADSQIHCNKCSPGYALILNQKYCAVLKTDFQCVLPAQQNCNLCSEGQVLSKNSYFLNPIQQQIVSLLSSQQLSLKRETLQKLITWMKNNDQSFQVLSQCLQPIVANCLQYDSVLRCINCKPGYQLVDGGCIFAVGLLFNTCKIYVPQSLTQCQECQEGYYITNDGCQSIKPIQNCLKYDPTTAFTSCTQCAQGYFAQHSTSCEPRVNSLAIQYCLVIENNSDACKQCALGYSLIKQNTQCIATTLNCKTMSDTTLPSSSCIQCNNGYYLNTQTGLCAQGSDSNCMVFQTHQNICSQCNNGYQLNPSTLICSAHTFYSTINCLSSSNTQKNYCETCQAGFIRVKNHTTCQYPSNPDPNCVQVNFNGTCIKCALQFYLNSSNNTCTAISIANCATVDSSLTLCTQCSVYNQSLQLWYELSIDQLRCNYPYPNRYQNTLQVKQESNYWGAFICNRCYTPSYESFFAAQCMASSNTMLSSYTSNLTNCLVFSFITNQCVECNPASSTPFVSSAGSCVSSCSSNEVLHLEEILSFQTQNTVFRHRKSFCKVPTNQQPLNSNTQTNYLVNNCLIYSIGLGRPTNGSLNTPLYGCVQCASGYSPVLNFTATSGSGYTQQIPMLATGYSSNQSQYKQGNRFSFIDQCISNATIVANYYTPINPPPTVSNVSSLNCKYFISIMNGSTQLYSCYSCNFGYSGNSFYAYTNYVLDQCVSVTNCQSSVVYGGFKQSNYGLLTGSSIDLPYPLDQLASCHICASGFTVVFAASAGNTSTYPSNQAAKGTIVQMGALSSSSTTLKDTNVVYSSSSLGPQTQCFSTSTLQSSFNMVSNCGMVRLTPEYSVQNTYTASSQTASQTTPNKMTVSSQGLVCTACLPGFRPLFDLNNQIGQCVPISNCIDNLSSTTAALNFSECNLCNTNFIYGFNKVLNQIDKGYCLQNQAVIGGTLITLSPNCYAGIQYQNSITCYVCQDDYMLNQNNICVKKQIADCQANNTVNISQTFSVSQIGVLDPYDNIIFLKRAGCGLCNSQNIIVIPNNTQTPAAQQLRTCVAKYHSVDMALCLSGPVIDCCDQNSIEGQNTQKCLQVNNNYVLNDQNQCLLAQEVVQDFSQGINIQNCLVQTTQTVPKTGYNNTQFLYNKVRICTQCNNGYYLFNNTCQQGSILNCNVYENSYVCKQCATNYIAVYNSINSSFCLLKNTNDLCQTYNSNYLKNGELYCSQCAAPTQSNTIAFINTIEDTYPLHYCLQIPPIQHCLNYSTSIDVMFSSFSCSQCANGYYLSNNICQQSTQIANCIEYNQYKDGCTKCSSGYLLLNENICQQDLFNDTNLYTCRTYDSLSSCFNCIKNFYLNPSDQKCYQVPKDLQIQNCLYFSSIDTCIQCYDNFYLQNNQCIQGAIDYCLVYKASSVCLKCQSNYGLQTLSPSQINCTLLNIDNCDVYDLAQPYPFICKQCSPGFYVTSNGKCDQLMNQIPQCRFYKDAFTCSLCDIGYFYMPSDNSCQSTEALSQFSDPTCQSVSLLSTPQCQVCKAGHYFNSQGVCTQCIYSYDQGCQFCDPTKPYTCMLCGSGYYMNTNGKCIRYLDRTAPENSSSVSQFAVLVALLLLLLV